MERSFTAEVQSLSLGAGQSFHGEGILAVTKALLQSGVGYVAGYQGAPVSHLIDVLGDAKGSPMLPIRRYGIAMREYGGSGSSPTMASACRSSPTCATTASTA